MKTSIKNIIEIRGVSACHVGEYRGVKSSGYIAMLNNMYKFSEISDSLSGDSVCVLIEGHIYFPPEINKELKTIEIKVYNTYGGVAGSISAEYSTVVNELGVHIPVLFNVIERVTLDRLTELPEELQHKGTSRLPTYRSH